jgi:hypothetical protein
MRKTGFTMAELQTMQFESPRLLALFSGRCGHRWIGAAGGSHGCPVCGDHEGDRHLIGVDELPVQVEDWGTAWKRLQRLGR